MISQWWQPEPTFKGMPFALALKERGYDVEVLTGFPNWPSGRVYPGYAVKPWRHERMAGIPIVRTALYPSHEASGLKHIASYLSFSISSFLLAPFLLKKADLIYVFNLVTLGPTALLLKILYRCPVVYDITDLWPDFVLASGMIPEDGSSGPWPGGTGFSTAPGRDRGDSPGTEGGTAERGCPRREDR